MALDKLLDEPGWQVVGLLGTLDRASDRVVMHDVRGDLVRAQAAALDLPLIEMIVDWPLPNAAYETALQASLDQARSLTPGLIHIAFGDLFLADLRRWREDVLQQLGWHGVFPLWNSSTRDLASALVESGHRAMVTTVDLERLDESFCGRPYDRQFLADLPPAVDPCGENGEFHTFCFDSPRFSTALAISPGSAATRFGRFRCVDFELARKPGRQDS